MAASGLPIVQLGSTIRSHLGCAEKYEGKAEEHYKSAGLHLLEAKARIASGEYDGKFGAFLLKECNSLSSSRAYELIAIANGTKTVEALRQEKAASMQRSRTVHNVADTQEPQWNQPLESENPRNPPPAASPRPKGGRPPAPKAPTEVLTAQVTKACRSLTVDQLRTLLQLIKAL